MEHPQLNLHDQRYMDRLLAKESYSRIGQLLKLIELKRDLTVADFACGNGVMLEVLHEKVGKYFGIDFSPSAIKNAELRKKKNGCNQCPFFL